jgi:hypothetical protein
MRKDHFAPFEGCGSHRKYLSLISHPHLSRPLAIHPPIPMSRYLCRAGLAIASAVTLSAAATRGASDPSSVGLLSPAAYRATPGHLALARAHPSLGANLDALLTPEAFLLNAAHALAVATLRIRPVSTESICLFRRGGRGWAQRAWPFQFALVLHDTVDACFEDALNALACLVAECPSDPRPRLAAAEGRESGWQ